MLILRLSSNHYRQESADAILTTRLGSSTPHAVVC